MAEAKYDPTFCERLVKHFTMEALYKAEAAQESYSPKTGSITGKKFIMVPIPPPHFAEFARKIGVKESTLDAWAVKHKDFGEAMQKAKDLQKETIVNGGLCGHYESRFAVVTAANLLGWKSDGEGQKKPEADNPVRKAWENRLKKIKEKEKADGTAKKQETTPVS